MTIHEVEQLTTEAVRSLVGLQMMIDHKPERATQAEEGLEDATRLMIEHGMLDVMITIARRGIYCHGVQTCSRKGPLCRPHALHDDVPQRADLIPRVDLRQLLLNLRRFA
jgi:hypothetical protein